MVCLVSRRKDDRTDIQGLVPCDHFVVNVFVNIHKLATGSHTKSDETPEQEVA